MGYKNNILLYVGCISAYIYVFIVINLSLYDRNPTPWLCEYNMENKTINGTKYYYYTCENTNPQQEIMMSTDLKCYTNGCKVLMYQDCYDSHLVHGFPHKCYNIKIMLSGIIYFIFLNCLSILIPLSFTIYNYYQYDKKYKNKNKSQQDYIVSFENPLYNNDVEQKIDSLYVEDSDSKPTQLEQRELVSV